MNLLIVDDQPNVVSSLALSIDWNAIGIANVYTASSALLAKDVMQKNHVDILLTDIQMPIESGLSLVEWVRQTGKNTACILISSHANFIYAKQAISLKVTDYILQPAREEDVLRAVQRAIAQIESEKNVRSVLNEFSFSVKEQAFAAQRFFEKWPDPSSPDFREELRKKVERINALDVSCTEDSPLFLFITRVDKWHAIPMDRYDFLSQYKKAVQKTMAYINGKPLLYSLSDAIFVTVLVLDHEENNIHDYFSLLQDDVLKEYACSISILYSRADFCTLKSLLSCMLQDDKLKVASIPSLIRQHQYLSPQKKQPGLSARRYYTKILNYIDAHVEEPVSRSQIADFIHISPDYVSHIIRESAGISSKELITIKKMTYAKKLLQTTSLPIGEVARRCGYDSFAYFSKVYRSVNGQSPTETRNLADRSSEACNDITF